MHGFSYPESLSSYHIQYLLLRSSQFTQRPYLSISAVSAMRAPLRRIFALVVLACSVGLATSQRPPKSHPSGCVALCAPFPSTPPGACQSACATCRAGDPTVGDGPNGAALVPCLCKLVDQFKDFFEVTDTSFKYGACVKAGGPCNYADLLCEFF
jgi:hypothetical protein